LKSASAFHSQKAVQVLSAILPNVLELEEVTSSCRRGQLLASHHRGIIGKHCSWRLQRCALLFTLIPTNCLALLIFRSLLDPAVKKSEKEDQASNKKIKRPQNGFSSQEKTRHFGLWAFRTRPHRFRTVLRLWLGRYCREWPLQVSFHLESSDKFIGTPLFTKINTTQETHWIVVNCRVK